MKLTACDIPLESLKLSPALILFPMGSIILQI